MLVLSFDKITVLAAISEGYYTTTGETGQELYDRRRIYQGKATGAFNSMGPLKNKRERNLNVLYAHRFRPLTSYIVT